MSKDHEEWLRKHGVRVTGKSTRRHALMPAFGFMKDNDSIDWAPQTIQTEDVYNVELTESLINRLQNIEDQLEWVTQHAQKTGGHIASFFLSNSERHLELIKENPMYRDAYREFQSIRALLRETPHWP
jgi:hypothetical protein